MKTKVQTQTPDTLQALKSARQHLANTVGQNVTANVQNARPENTIDNRYFLAPYNETDIPQWVLGKADSGAPQQAVADMFTKAAPALSGLTIDDANHAKSLFQTSLDLIAVALQAEATSKGDQEVWDWFGVLREIQTYGSEPGGYLNQACQKFLATEDFIAVIARVTEAEEQLVKAVCDHIKDLKAFQKNPEKFTAWMAQHPNRTAALEFDVQSTYKYDTDEYAGVD